MLLDIVKKIKNREEAIEWVKYKLQCCKDEDLAGQMLFLNFT